MASKPPGRFSPVNLCRHGLQSDQCINNLCIESAAVMTTICLLIVIGRKVIKRLRRLPGPETEIG